MFDDTPNIIENRVLIEGGTWGELAFSVKSGPLYRPLPMVSFGVNYAVGGLHPWGYKLTNVVIHIFCCFSVLFFLLQLLRGLRASYQQLTWLDDSMQWWAATIIALLWGLHPINLTSVLYIVQRMTSLSALFALLGMGLYCLGRNRLRDGLNGWPAILLAGFLAFPLAVFSKENALVWPLWIILLEFTVFRFDTTRLWEKRILKVGALAGLAVVLLTCLWLALNVEWLLRAYLFRDFSLEERLLTQSRVLWMYVYWILVPTPGQLGLYHDGVIVSQSLFAPWTTIGALLAWGLVIGFTLWSYKRFPWLIISMAFFAIAHMIESSVIGLEMVHEHRNYLASLAILTPFGVSITWLLYRAELRRLGVALLVVSIGVLYFSTTFRANQWSSWPKLVWHQVISHPDSARSNYEAGIWYFNEILSTEEKNDAHVEQANKYFSKVTELNGHEISGLIGQLRLKDLLGEPWSRDDALYQELLNRLQTSPVGEARGAFLIDWFLCNQRGYCHLKNAMVEEVLNILLSREQVSVPIKARLTNLYGVMLFQQKNMSAAEYFALAVEFDDTEREYWISLIISLTEMGELQVARRALADFSQTQPSLYALSKEKLSPYEMRLRDVK